MLAPILVIAFYVVIGLGVVGLAVALYLRAVVNRKVYRCPHCGEITRVELMRASHCNVCGSPLFRSEEDDDQT